MRGPLPPLDEILLGLGLVRAPRARPRPAPASVVLDVLRDVLGHIHHADLHAVDGSFIWRCCWHQPLKYLEGIEAYRARAATDAEWERADDARADLADLLGEAFADMADRYSRDGWLALRAPRALATPGTAGGVGPFRPHVRVEVASSSTNGADVEALARRVGAGAEALTRRTGLGDCGDDGGDDPVQTRSRVAVEIAFAPGGGAAVPWTSLGEAVGDRPLVVVEVDLPLPRPGLVADYFDRWGSENSELYGQLPGAGARQTTLTAARTWAISLLVARGRTFDRAAADVADVTGWGEDPDRAVLSKKVHYAARKVLLARVPEAAPYLEARSRGRRGTG